MAKEHPHNLIDFSDLSIATAYLEKDEDLIWSILWQNDAAQALWSDYDVNADISLKLSLIDIYGTATPRGFDHQLNSGFQNVRFLVSPYEEGLLLQFYLDTHTKDSSGDSVNSVYELIVEASRVGAIDLDLQTQQIQYSDKVYELCSLDYSLLGSHLDQFIARIHPQDVQTFKDAFESHLELNWPFQAEFRIKTSSGTYLWFSSKGKKVFQNGDDKPVRFVATLEDISERKRFEGMVQSREELISQIIDTLPVSIYVKDEKGAYRFFSHQAATETGLDKQKVIGRTDFELFPIEKARKQVMHDAEVSKSEKIAILEEKVREQNGEGQERWYLRGKGPIKVDYDEQIRTWLLGFSVDISHQKLVEDKLIQAKDAAEASAKAKADFLSVMSHEIRTPLNSVIGGSQLLMTEDLDEEHKKHVELIHHSGEHLLNLINDILDYSKMDAGKLDLESQDIDLCKVAETVLEMNQVNAKKKGVTLVLDYDSQVPRYRSGDIARIRQLLLNLLTNAVKFTEHGSVTLAVLAGQKPESVLFRVIDSGIGISEENIGKLFSEFTQADASTTRKYGGTGLGLAICRKIVEAMDGKIGVESQLGRGSTFWFEIDMNILSEPVSMTSSASRIHEASSQSHQALNILVAEDNPTNQILIRAILKKLNHQIELAENGLEAIKALEQDNHFDLVLMDMQMPEMDGVEATKQIRNSQQAFSDIPVIALTANASESAKSEVMEAGMNDFLTKPVDIVALKKMLDYWASRIQEASS